MKHKKRYLAGMLAVLMLVCSINIGTATNDSIPEEAEAETEIETDSVINEIASEENEQNNLIETGINIEEDKEVEESSNEIEKVLEEELENNSEIETEVDVDLEENKVDSETLEVNTDLENKAESENNESIIDEDKELEENDNWELGLVFYDSTVDNGKTPLTEINWDASDGGYKAGEARVITVQINYRNTNAVTTYQPGNLKISIPNLIYNTENNEENNPFWKTSVIVGANDSTHIGYDWNFITGSLPTNKQKTYEFTNVNTIEEKSNFEGSIQIVYTITPKNESPEKYEDECIHSFNIDLITNIENIVESNSINFNYTRKYTHPWKYPQYTVTKTAKKITSYDGLGENADDYIWIKYGFYFTYNAGISSMYSNYPFIYADNIFYNDKIPKECIAYDENGNLLIKDESGNCSVYNKFSSWGKNYPTYMYVGYPKNIYNEENKNLNIINEVELWGTYKNKTEPEYLAKNDISLNLSKFEFVYTGDLYKVTKNNGYYGVPYNLRYQDIIANNGDNYIRYTLHPTAIYSGKPMSIKIADDLLFATNKNSEYVKLQDDEYYFSNIYLNPKLLKNGNNQQVSPNKYDCELYVRYANTNQYVSYEQFKNPSSTKTWSFTQEEGIVGFYFMFYDIKESIISSNGITSSIEASLKFIKKDIPESGIIYNFDYMQVYFKDADGNFILQNEPNVDSYSNLITKEEIAKYDQETYGVYLQRGCTYNKWEYYHINTQKPSIVAGKKILSNITQNVLEESFNGTFNISSCFQTVAIEPQYSEQYNGINTIKGFKLYDLLPKGMNLTSTSEDITNSVKVSTYNGLLRFYDLNLNPLKNEKVKEMLTTEVNITENWKNTGRTKIEIIGVFNEPIYCSNGDSKNDSISYQYNFSIPYDAYLEYGNIWTNYCYADRLEIQENEIDLKNTSVDNGEYDKDVIDIDEDENIEDEFSYAKAQITITSVISTHQDVTKYVKTNKSEGEYSTGTVENSFDSLYEYKLRVKTGENNITNLILYDSIEEYTQDKDGNVVTSYGDKKHWNGEFLGIDTSYAESKGYKVKVYYSEDVKAGNLSDDDSWKEYSDSVDKTKVKSLAFEYLDAEGNPAKLPANSLTYVLIKMKSPNDEKITNLAYNGCRTQWQALDEFEQPVDFITGINSNIVKVSLPNSEIYGSYKVNHEYYKREYIDANALAITFNTKCAGESASYDYIEIYYKKDGNTYKLGRYRANDLAGKTINIPSEDFYLYWRTDGSGNNYYGFSIDNIETIKLNETITGTSATLPNYTPIELSGTDYPETEHNPYKNSSNILWHYNSNLKFGENLILENTVSEDEVLDIPIGTTIKADEQNRIFENNGNVYEFTEDTGDIVIEKDKCSEITLKYIREDITYGSYIVKHEYYVQDKDGNLTLENTVSEDEVSDVIAGTIIEANTIPHIEENNEKTYVFTEDSGDITIEKDIQKEIILKYVRQEEYGSYIVNHEYYVRDLDGSLTLESTYSEDEISDVIAGTVIKADELNHILQNGKYEYIYSEDTGNVTIEANKTSEITIKYVREKEYTAELPETGGNGNGWIFRNIIFFGFIGMISFAVAKKRKKV